MIHRTIPFLCFLVVSVASSLAAAAERPNVLFIAVDDLRPELGCYGAKHIKSPNIDELARRGLTFERAYCQQAVCNPSRTSLMTGLRPNTIGVTHNHVHFRSKKKDVVTLPQHFKQHGYHAQSIGKIFHGVFPEGASKTTWDTMGDPQSWSVPTTRFGPRYYYTEDGIRQAKQAFQLTYRPKSPRPDDWTKKLVFGPMTEAPEVPDNKLYDGKVADAAVATLQGLKKEPDTPFFLAVGFIKPHTPFVAPKKYWDLYDPKRIGLASTSQLPSGAPSYAGHSSGEIRRYTDQPKRGPFSNDRQRRLRHGYYACISYIDAQVGRILEELKRLELDKNTIIVLFGDHGWHLGEKGLWGKTTNFELDCRAPLIVSAPKMKAAGRKSNALAEFIDIYPTLSELAGLPLPKSLDGTSFRPLLDEAGREHKPTAFSQYPRGKRMGYSMRTSRWRYTEWIEQDSGKLVANELYDHESDPQETVDLASDRENAKQVHELSQQLRRGLGMTLPKPARLLAYGTSQPRNPHPAKWKVLLKDGVPASEMPAKWTRRDEFIEGSGKAGLALANLSIGKGAFRLKARLRIQDQKKSAASFFLDDNHFGFEGARETLFVGGATFGEVKLLSKSTDVFKRGAWIDFEVVRDDDVLHFLINDEVVHKQKDNSRGYETFGFNPFRGIILVSDVSVAGDFVKRAPPLPTFDVFVPGKDPYPRIRIPAIVTSKKGTLLAFAEGRQGGDHSKNDIILKRSTDSGKTWGKLQVLHDAGDHALNNPQPVVLDSGRVLIIYQRNKHGERGVRPGYKGPDVGYTLIQHSDDDGVTWSKPRDITRGVKRPAPITSHASGPGVGIVLRKGKHKGRIIMPFNQGPFGKWKVYAAYSDDDGATWKYGDTAPDGGKGVGNEVQMVELADGRLMLNSRVQGGTNVRKIAYSDDSGQTWLALRDEPQLPEPRCQGTIIRYSWPADGKSRILFANPASQKGRTNGTIRLSYDEGKSWPVSKTVYKGGYAYSCLTVLRDGSIGLLFEADGYRRTCFVRVTLDWLTDGKDSTDNSMGAKNQGSSDSQLVFAAEKDRVGNHGYKNFREPAVVKTRSGRLVVSCQAGNRLSWPERSGQDLAIRYSDDKGKTWSPIVVIAEHGNYSVQSPGMVYDAEKNRIICLYVTMNWDYTLVGKNRGSKYVEPFIKANLGKGLKQNNIYLVHSDDGGQTWSKPKDISSLTPQQAHFGAGEGRQLTIGKYKGRLVLAGGLRTVDTGGTVTKKITGVWVSDDHGVTWRFNDIRFPAAIDGNPRQVSCEARVSELSDGRLIYNVRTRSRGRHLAYSSDGGETWSEAVQDPHLKAVACNACMLTLRNVDGELTDHLLCSLPSPKGRRDGVIYASFDGGKTWKQRQDILPSGFFAYSALVQIDNESIGLLYEANHYKDIRFLRLPMRRFTK